MLILKKQQILILILLHHRLSFVSFQTSCFFSRLLLQNFLTSSHRLPHQGPPGLRCWLQTSKMSLGLAAAIHWLRFSHPALLSKYKWDFCAQHSAVRYLS